MRYERAEKPLKLDGLVTARNFFAGCLAEGDRSGDALWVAHVDEQSRCLHLSCHQREGGNDFPIAKVIADAAAHHSAGLIIAHKSSEPRPTRGDCAMTRQLTRAVEPLDCTILDHLLFTGRQCTSMRRLGYL